MKGTKNARTALERLLAAYEQRGIKSALKKTAPGYYRVKLMRDGKRPVVYGPHRAASVLALLADLALWSVERGGAGMTRTEVAEAIRLNAAPKAAAGWQEETLAGLAGTDVRTVVAQRKAARAASKKLKNTTTTN